MSDEDLLKRAEQALEDIKIGPDNLDFIQAKNLSSIAHSLLVIARNSVPVNVSVEYCHECYRNVTRFGHSIKCPRWASKPENISPEPSVDDGKNHNTGEVFVKP